MKKLKLTSIGLGLTLLIAACSLPEVTRNMPVPDPTSVYKTVSAQLTLTAQPVMIPSPTRNTTPAIPTPTAQPIVRNETRVEPTRTSALIPDTLRCDLAASSRPSVDITVPDGSRFKPSESFSKTWRLLNAGSCPWTQDYAVTWFSGENFSAAREQAFNKVILPGETVDITLDMIAPRQAGLHQSNWKLRNKQGALFGIGPAGDAPFWVRIEVVEMATATLTPQPTITATATLSIASKGAVDLHAGQAINLDTGKVGTGAGDDLSLQKLDANTLKLVAVNGAMLAYFGPQIPMDQDCRNPGLASTPILGSALKIDDYLCIRTSQGLPGYIRIKTLALKDEWINLDYLVWAIP